jgi:heme/copper-type cytochrome/quinol oxidase subunit 3
MVETYDLKTPHQTHTQGPPPIVPPPPDGPDDGGSHGDEGQEPRRFPLKHAHLVMLIVMGVETMLFATLVSACLIFRQGSQVWPPSAFAQLPTSLPFLATLLLTEQCLHHVASTTS